MNRRVSGYLRKLVAERAEFIGEYCHFPDAFSFFPFQIDHIIGITHGGETKLENLAYTCLFCNAHKGTNIATILLPNQEFVGLFNPRTEIWNEHFEIREGLIIGKTIVSNATVKVLQLNKPERVQERKELGI